MEEHLNTNRFLSRLKRVSRPYERRNRAGDSVTRRIGSDLFIFLRGWRARRPLGAVAPHGHDGDRDGAISCETFHPGNLPRNPNVAFSNRAAVKIMLYLFAKWQTFLTAVSSRISIFAMPTRGMPWPRKRWVCRRSFWPRGSCATWNWSWTAGSLHSRVFLTRKITNRRCCHMALFFFLAIRISSLYYRNLLSNFSSVI